MKKILEDLYFGEIQPNISYFSENSGVQIIDNTTEILLKRLKGEERKLFIKIIDAQNELDADTAVKNFICGFKMGAKIIMEVICDE